MKHLVLVALLTFISAGGCALSRADQLRAKSEKVESVLVKERDRVVKLGAEDSTRQPRLNHLTSLKTTLSGANVALSSVPYLLEPKDRDLAYDVLEEVYGTIEWNIPLGPGDPMRALPSQFSNGTLKLK